MKSSGSVRKGPFLVATAVIAIVTLALMRLSELMVEKLRRNAPLTSSQSGWAYRFLALAAIAQALYVGLVLLRPDRVKAARERDPKLSAMNRAETARSVARNAAFIACLTLVYGLTAFALSGQRAGFWLFFAVAVLQVAWYFRQAGEIARFMSFQPEYVNGYPREPETAPVEHSDYAPPLARGVGHADE